MSVVTETHSKRSEREAGLVLVAGMAGLMWIVEVIDQISGGDLERYGIRPHHAAGLVGIVTAPFLHAGFGHLVANTIPFLALGATIALSGLARVAAATAIVALVAGLGTWLVAPATTDHIGASGIVFGYAAYLVARGAYSRSVLHLAVGFVVLAVYGTTLALGVIPTDGISWQGHLFGAIGGVVAARALDRRRARPSERPALAA